MLNKNVSLITQKKEPSKNIIQTLHEAYMSEVSVIPVDHNKTPLIKWKEYQQRKPTREELFQWESIANGIAIITGKINNLVVLDVDIKKGNGFESLKNKRLPVTPAVKTKSGGFHYYFKYPKKVKNVKTASNILPNIDIRGDGGYAVIPYTDGYEWVEGLSPKDIEYAEMPEWLFDITTNKVSRESTLGVKQVNEYSFTCDTLQDVKSVIQLKRFDKNSLLSWYEQQEVAERFQKLLGIDVALGQSFKCVIPGHSDKTPSASIYKGDNGLFIYRDWHKHDGKEIFFLPEVYASIHYKKVIKVGKPEFSLWSIRLLVDLKIVESYKINRKSLPKDVTPTIKKVYEGFCHLLSCKWLYTPNEPTPFSWRFAKGWCGVSERKAGEAIKYLLAHNYIRIVSRERFRGKEMALFTLVDERVKG